MVVNVRRHLRASSSWNAHVQDNVALDYHRLGVLENPSTIQLVAKGSPFQQTTLPPATQSRDSPH